ncbi:MAG: response regulator [Candidatus Dojkabacteria bacterium]|jgi:two-component system chemotaxis response regulator CheY|nr:response regulator [Candidatus Dojkabacteria bacterium]
MKKQILIVDDDYFFRRMLSSRLRDSHVDVVEAKNGQEGCDIIARSKIDLTLLDLMMPFYDGFDFLEARTLDEKIRKIPVIVMSLLRQKKDVEMVSKYEILDYIIKPETSIKDIQLRVMRHLSD